MSRQLGSAEPELGALAVRAVIELPDSIGLTSLRALGWPMAELIASEYRLNLLSAEALAAAEVLGAEICLAASDANPPLIEAAKRRGVPLRVIEV